MNPSGYLVGSSSEDDETGEVILDESSHFGFSDFHVLKIEELFEKLDQ